MWPNKRSAAEIARIFGTRDVLATYHFLGRLGGLIMAGSNRACAERAIGLLEVRPQDRVLEVGFGPGVAIELLARVPARHVVGVDPSTEMLEQAAVRNAAGVASGRVELQQGSVERLPFADATFDKALAINSMQVWPDVVAGLRELRRVLAPSGRIALGFTPYSGQPRTGVVETLAAARFAKAHLVESETTFCALATKP
jgi:ubiquinone/menaquinone biosynthesis C-methylase UbiE